jgi:DNA-binding transcriptional regulator YiaG
MRENKLEGRHNMDTVKELKSLRESVGMNLTDFSAHLGIPRRTMDDWEKGKRKPPDYILELISYRLKYEALVGENDSNS